MKCSCKHCIFPATHKQENLKDSELLGKTPGTFNYFCAQHAPIFIDLYEQGKKLREEHASKVPGNLTAGGLQEGRIAVPFGPVVPL